MRLVSHASGPLRGRLALPGDKSISHRALILGALAVGRSTIRGLLDGADVQATWRALETLGVRIGRQGDAVVVDGVGLGGLREPDEALDLGNSGTGVRLLMGPLAAAPFPTVLTGDASLRSRPMGRVIDPLMQMGAQAIARTGARLPLTMIGAERLMPIHHTSQFASAQVKSAVLLAGLHAPGRTTVTEPTLSRDHTENMLAAMGAELSRSETASGGVTVGVRGEPVLHPLNVDVPADPSSAAFPLAAALLVPGSAVTLERVGLNPTRVGLLDVLRRMGAEIDVVDARQMGGEPVGDLRVVSSALRATEVPAATAPAMIDEYPILAVVAARASGRTVMHGLGELRVKETDRLAAMAQGLTAAGIAVEEGPDWLAVTGDTERAIPGGIVVDANHDHRIAMSFAVLGLAAARPIEVQGAETIATSFPSFVDRMRSFGAELEGT